MSKIAQSIHARVTQLATPAGSESAAEPSEAAPPVAEGSAVDSGSAASPPPAEASVDPTVDPNGDTEEAATKRAILAEKLKAVRAKNRERKLSKETLTAKEQAEADRQAAAAERAKYEALRTGTFKETLEALGRDPREVFKEMQKEAIEAGTPEAELRRMRGDFERQMGEKLKPLADTIEELKRQNEALLEERRQLSEREQSMSFQNDFRSNVDKPDFTDLRIEYGDQRLYRLAEGMKSNPSQLRAHAKELGVRLTYADSRFTMTDILNVLNAAHVAHETEKKQRRERMQAPETSTGAPQQAPATAKTVNGTAERRNAANPLGNDTAASNASAPARSSRLSRQGRIERAMQRDAGRRG